MATSSETAVTLPTNNTSSDLKQTLYGLEPYPDRVLVSLYVLWNMDQGYPTITKDTEQRDYIDVIKSQIK
ncbi:hypothetical protein EJ02DRAFT_102314 [Clathrospora elynae]|uniref:Uncharacterized protein n=1 Tax=Clathrospora elynae TaxID=706981 RepID=A0A6A5S966_9PLEO|nr:hypothetical protein EJ02DRAFT_102314 [Clathrospora elynae]